jgi:Transposase IS66 family
MEGFELRRVAIAVAHASVMPGSARQYKSDRRVGQLYGIESDIRGRLPNERWQVRQARARPILESLHEWLESCLAKLSRASDTTTAVRYALTL